MTTATQSVTITVALVGNPNTGKSTLFSALSGLRQRVGNYPGVTVEKKIGHLDFGGRRFELVDLPGTYSLAPRSLDEMVAVDVLLGQRDDVARPDVVLSIVDASNLERNLYLTSQVLELGLPTVVALNMTDVARDKGVTIDLPRLRQQLGVPVVELEAHRKLGVAELKQALLDAASAPVRPRITPFPDAFGQEVRELETVVQAARGQSIPRYLVERLLLDSGGYIEQQLLDDRHQAARTHLLAARQRLRDAGLPVPAIEAMARYDWVARTLEGVVTRPAERRIMLTDRIDAVLTHKWLGTLIFAVMMLLLFSSIFIAAQYPMEWIEAGIGQLGEWIGGSMPEGALRSLIVDGVIGGVGSVIVFLPQIMILFLFIAILEDCGYMARAAYLMDKLMCRVGLSGKSFIPLLSSFACAIPGIMATRVIENRRDRLTTILVAPLMSCSARLPVYTVLVAAFIPTSGVLGRFLPGLTFFAMYLVGIVVAVAVALVLKRTLLRGETPPFVMELPSYKFPSFATVLHRMFERGWAFIARAGTIVFAVSIVMWAALYYPQNEELIERETADIQAAHAAELAALPAGSPERETREVELAQELKNLQDGIQERNSYLGRMGHWIEPAVRPLGWDWRIGSAAIASFPAREVIIGVLGVIYNLGGELDDEAGQASLAARLREARWDDTGELVYNVPVALSIMVFFALCAQCAATLAVIRRETNSWSWPAFTFVYMTGLAYLGALVTYQVGRLL